MARIVGWLISFVVLGGAAEVRAQDRWNGPFGGTWTATVAFVSEYSYRGISQTDRQPAGQLTIGYAFPLVGDSLSLYLEGWGTNVEFPASTLELAFSAALQFRALDGKLAFEAGYSRYEYPEAPAELQYGYNEFNFAVSYDFRVFQLAGTVNYSPNYFGNGGAAWYKSAQVAVPLKFLSVNKDVSFTLFGSIGNQYTERYLDAGFPTDNYWDWEIALKARIYGVGLALAYVDTNLEPAGCSDTYNCEGRLVFRLSKTF